MNVKAYRSEMLQKLANHTELLARQMTQLNKAVVEELKTGSGKLIVSANGEIQGQGLSIDLLCAKINLCERILADQELP